jgi:hypothetical protein
MNIYLQANKSVIAYRDIRIDDINIFVYRIFPIAMCFKSYQVVWARFS